VKRKFLLFELERSWFAQKNIGNIVIFIFKRAKAPMTAKLRKYEKSRRRKILFKLYFFFFSPKNSREKFEKRFVS
jgi:hypothetical protein